MNDNLFSPPIGIFCTVNVTYSELCEIWLKRNTQGEWNDMCFIFVCLLCKQNKWLVNLGIRDNFRVS